MPSWTKKDRRKYEHIKEGSQKRGVSTDRAEEIAARTVNKQRREEGRTPNKATQGTGNPKEPVEEKNINELHNLAKELDIKGRSSMNKDDLIRAIKKQRNGQ